MSHSSPHPQVISFPRRHATTRRFTLGAPRSFSVSDDGSRVLFLRSSGPEDPQNSLWVVEPGEAARAVFDATGSTSGSLTDAERARRERMREQASGVVSFAARPDCTEAVFALAGQLYKSEVSTGESVELASDGNVFDPQFEPGADRIAYVSGSTLRLTSGADDQLVPGTDEGGDLVSWGSAEFVAAEEMGRGRGYWWSPEGQQMAVCRVDTAPVEEWWISSPERPAVAPRSIRYPAAGTENADVQLWIVDVDEGPVHQIDWQQGEFEYLADVKWGEQLLLTVQTRDQRVRVVLVADPSTGDVTEIQRDTDDRWVELFANTPHASSLGLVTIADDAHARRVSIDGEFVSGVDVNVRQFVGVVDHTVLVTVTTDATNSVLARLERDGSLELLSSVDHFTSVVCKGGTMVVTEAGPDIDTSYEVTWTDGTTTTLESYASSPGFPCTPEFHVVAERSLNLALCLPEGHDGSPLPVLLDPYGGPHAQRVLRVRNAHASSQWFAEQGFAVVVIDGRGTPGRGPAFEREIYGDFATKVLDDQIEALEALAAVRSEIDLGRVGMRGWSFGGYLAALAVMRRPDAVHAAIAGAPVTDWRLYDTHYTERYLGHPNEHPEHYEQSGLISDAPSLDRPLMLIHGLADDNVVAAHTLTLSQALLEAGRAHEVLPLSGVTHMTPQEQVAENLLHLQRDFLLTHLSRDTGSDPFPPKGV